MEKNILITVGTIISAILIIFVIIFFLINILKNPKSGNVKIASDPSGANVYINGKKIEKVTPMQLKLEKKYHNIKIEKEGYFPYEKVINLMENSKEEINVTLESFESNPKKYKEYQEQLKNTQEYEESEKEYRENLDKLYQEQPLTRYLPYGDADFSMYYSLEKKIYIIEIPLDYNLYKENYTNTLQNAYNWIKSKGVDPNKLRIEIKDKTLPKNAYEEQPG